MKRFSFLVLFGALLLMPLACTALEDTDDLGRFSGFSIMVDKSQTNKYSQQAFCHEWKFVSTELEVWEDGRLSEMKEVSNIFPYRNLKFLENGNMSADGMGGVWDYKYNNLMIDVSTSGGSNYLYQVVEVKGGKMVLREEDYYIGGPIVTFLQDPSGKHYFCRYTYVKK